MCRVRCLDGPPVPLSLVERLEKSPHAPYSVAVDRTSSARKVNLVVSFYIPTGKSLCSMGSIQLLSRHHASNDGILRAVSHAHLKCRRQEFLQRL